MMTDEPAIVLDNVSKMYHKRAGMGTLLSMVPGLRPSESDAFWALEDVSFEVRRGEFVGIIGPNGAGKSTILKILSRITSPTSGSYRVNGRLSSLIEVGAGFHPELTGRENVYLNAAILGMSKREIDAKFDAIVDFAELWDFIDVPVKRYSSGMYVRLGFAVAAHTEPDVLLVDEVLAVGDASFSQKCEQRIQQLLQSGTSMIVVSHNRHVIIQVSNRALLLDRGGVRALGPSKSVIQEYAQCVAEARAAARGGVASADGIRDAEIVSLHILDDAGNRTRTFTAGAGSRVEMLVRFYKPVKAPVVGMVIRSADGVEVYGTNTWIQGMTIGPVEAGDQIRATFAQNLPLVGGSYQLDMAVADMPIGVAHMLDSRYGMADIAVIGDERAVGIADLMSRVECTLEKT